MAGKDSGNSAPNRSAEEAALARVYRTAAKEQPPAALDARIRAAAREAANAARPRGLKHWAVPFAIAATVVLGVSIVVQMSQQGLIEPEGAAFKPAASPESAATPAPSVQAPREISKSAPETRREVAPSEVSKLKKDTAPGTQLRERADRVQPSGEAGARLPSKSSEVAAAFTAKEASGPLADVTKVQVSGSPGGYYFSVTIRSPDSGCAQYADWWEVVGADGKLLYRRVLLHSHTDEQPFERSGGPVPVQPDATVWVRAHMNTSGYGGGALRGSVKSGFIVAMPPPGFAAEIATLAPLPDGCAF